MGKHSFSSDENNFEKIPDKNRKFLSDYSKFEFSKTEYKHESGSFKENQKDRVSVRIAKWSILPLIGSIIIIVLLLLDITVNAVLMRAFFVSTWALWLNAFVFYGYEKSDERARIERDNPKVRKDLLPLGAWLLIPSFLLIPFGLFNYPGFGIFSGILVFVGSLLTLTNFIFIERGRKYSKNTLLAKILTGIMLPFASIAFFSLIGIIISFFSEISS